MSTKDKPDAWMPLYIGDWDSGTAHLDCEQDGAYGRLIRHYWKNGPLADNDAQLARIVRMDLRKWRKIRSVLVLFFVIKEGFWRHKFVDGLIIDQAEKRRNYIARASSGGKAKAAKSTATSTPQAVLKSCPSASATEEEAPNRASSLRERNDADALADGAPPPCAWTGPETVRQAFCAAHGEEWCRKFLDACRWQDVPDRALIPPHRLIGARILKDARATLAKLGLTILENAA